MGWPNSYLGDPLGAVISVSEVIPSKASGASGSKVWFRLKVEDEERNLCVV